jgi:hypothetical protein
MRRLRAATWGFLAKFGRFASIARFMRGTNESLHAK